MTDNATQGRAAHQILGIQFRLGIGEAEAMAKAFLRARWLLIGLLGLGLWLTPGATYGHSRELLEAYNRAGTLYGQGRYGEALPFAKRAVGLGEQEFGASNPRFATLLNNLANLYLYQGRYADAEPLYERALAIREKALGPEHPRVATSLENYAALLRATNRSDEAEELEARAAAIRAKQVE